MCSVIVLFDDVMPFLIHFGILWGEFEFKKKTLFVQKKGLKLNLIQFVDVGVGHYKEKVTLSVAVQTITKLNSQKF